MIMTNTWTLCRTSRIRVHLVITASFINLLLGTQAMGIGEKYSTEGNLVYRAIVEHLINKGLCRDFESCARDLQIFGENGNRVNLNMYGQHTSKLSQNVANFLLEHGLTVSRGIPLTLRVFAEPKIEHTGFRSLISPMGPKVLLEINK